MWKYWPIPKVISIHSGPPISGKFTYKLFRTALLIPNPTSTLTPVSNPQAIWPLTKFEVHKINTYRYQYPNDLVPFWIKFEPDLLWGPTRERRRWWPSGLRWFRATERPETCRYRLASIRKLAENINKMLKTKGTTVPSQLTGRSFEKNPPNLT